MTKHDWPGDLHQAYETMVRVRLSVFDVDTDPFGLAEVQHGDELLEFLVLSYKDSVLVFFEWY